MSMIGSGLLRKAYKCSQLQFVRTRVYCSKNKGKEKCVKAAVKRMMKLDNDLYVRPQSGRYGQMWSKSKERNEDLQKFLILNRTQSKMMKGIFHSSSWLLERFAFASSTQFINRFIFSFHTGHSRHFTGILF
ncbi:hypothetical protein SNEBB_001688 [Seison nebaliae]|nr:hypothetical protein SNEBB_001688 [Seison nebaliae]